MVAAKLSIPISMFSPVSCDQGRSGSVRGSLSDCRTTPARPAHDALSCQPTQRGSLNFRHRAPVTPRNAPNIEIRALFPAIRIMG
jgi:hypothetical protein